MILQRIHHVAIICSDYSRSKKFYTEVLGLKIIRETFREHRDSYKLDLALNDGSQIELFSFPNPPNEYRDPRLRDSATWLSKWRISIDRSRIWKPIMFRRSRSGWMS